MQNVYKYFFRFVLNGSQQKKRRCFISLADDKLRKMFHLNVFFLNVKKDLKSKNKVLKKCEKYQNGLIEC